MAYKHSLALFTKTDSFWYVHTRHGKDKNSYFINMFISQLNTDIRDNNSMKTLDFSNRYYQRERNSILEGLRSLPKTKKLFSKVKNKRHALHVRLIKLRKMKQYVDNIVAEYKISDNLNKLVSMPPFLGKFYIEKNFITAKYPKYKYIIKFNNLGLDKTVIMPLLTFVETNNSGYKINYEFDKIPIYNHDNCVIGWESQTIINSLTIFIKDLTTDNLELLKASSKNP
jgi:hypothetical protein